MPASTEQSENVTHVGDGSVCEEPVSAEHQVTVEVHIEGGGPTLAISWCRKCHAACMVREQIRLSIRVLEGQPARCKSTNKQDVARNVWAQGGGNKP